VNLGFVLRTVAAAAAVLFLADLWLIWMADAYLHVGTYAFGDFVTYWTGASHLLSGAPLYAPEQLSGPYHLPDMDYGSGYVYPPTAALLSAPLVLLPADVAWAVFTGLGLVALGWLVALVARREGIGRVGAAAVVAVVLSSGPVAQAVLSGNVNLWMGVGVAAAWLWPRSSTALAVVGALIKLYPGLGVLWAIRTRTFRWWPIVAGAAFGLAVVAIFGAALWTQFLTSLVNARPLGAAFPQPPRAILDPYVGPVLASAAAWLLTAMLGFAALFVRDDRFAFFVLSLAMILPAQEWHAHYYLVPMMGALPGVLSILRAWRPRLEGAARPAPPGAVAHG
jgi:hypothetical protein